MGNKWKECVYTDERGRKSIRVAPDCTQAKAGLIVSIVWEEVFTDFTDEQLDVLYKAAWERKLIRPSDITRGESYDILYKALQRVGYAAQAARELGTNTITIMRGALNDG